MSNRFFAFRLRMTNIIYRHTEALAEVSVFSLILTDSSGAALRMTLCFFDSTLPEIRSLGFPSQKQVVRFTTLALTFVFVTSGLRYRFALRKSAILRILLYRSRCILRRSGSFRFYSDKISFYLRFRYSKFFQSVVL